MAEKCSQGTVNDSCSSPQNFCSINGQKVSQNSGISATLNSITQYNTTVTDTIWNSIYTALKNIYNYGLRGTRNPDIYKTENGAQVLKFSNVSDGDTVLQSLYNQAINFISTNKTISNQPIITKDLMTTLQTTINNYELNTNRCNSCNTKCNTTCQAADQCTCGNQNNQCGDCMWMTMCGRCNSRCQDACAEGYPMACSQGGCNGGNVQ